MRKTFLAFGFILSGFTAVNAQSAKDTSLQITGSADLYYKYDFNGDANTPSNLNAKVGMRQNTLEFGMLDLKIKKKLGDVTVLSELAFGQRETSDASAPPSYNIQNLYATYQASKKLSLTGGIMYRYQTYEKLNAADNFNYTISSSFTIINFLRSAGIKATYEFNDNAKLVVGMYNSNDSKNGTNRTVASPNYGLSDFCAQGFIKNPFGLKGFDASAAIWLEGQKDNGTHLNLQLHYKATEKLKLGLDATNYKCADTKFIAARSYDGYVGYAQYAVCKAFSLGSRYDYLNVNEYDGVSFQKQNYYAATITGALNLGTLTLKAEYKRDWTTADNLNPQTIPYYESDAITHSVNAAEVVLAAVYRF